MLLKGSNLDLRMQTPNTWSAMSAKGTELAAKLRSLRASPAIHLEPLDLIDSSLCHCPGGESMINQRYIGLNRLSAGWSLILTQKSRPGRVFLTKPCRKALLRTGCSNLRIPDDCCSSQNATARVPANTLLWGAQSVCRGSLRVKLTLWWFRIIREESTPTSGPPNLHFAYVCPSARTIYIFL